MKRLLLSALLALLSFGSLNAETSDSPAVVARQVSPEIPHVGDFVLRDLEGKLIGVGRFMVSFASVCEVLANGSEARGACDFVYVSYLEGARQQAGVHQMRYFINFDESTVHLNTNLPGSEYTLQFVFDPSLEFSKGSVKKGLGHGGEEVGTVSIRIRDPKEN